MMKTNWVLAELRDQARKAVKCSDCFSRIMREIVEEIEERIEARKLTIENVAETFREAKTEMAAPGEADE